MNTDDTALSSEDLKKLEKFIKDIDDLSVKVGADGSFDILEELYLLITKILDRYPELELEDDENIE